MGKLLDRLKFCIASITVGNVQSIVKKALESIKTSDVKKWVKENMATHLLLDKANILSKSTTAIDSTGSLQVLAVNSIDFTGWTCIERSRDKLVVLFDHNGLYIFCPTSCW